MLTDNQYMIYRTEQKANTVRKRAKNKTNLLRRYGPVIASEGCPGKVVCWEDF